MSRWTPCKRRDFIRRLRVLGFNGPLAGTRHSFMIYEGHRLTVPAGGGWGEREFALGVACQVVSTRPHADPRIVFNRPGRGSFAVDVQ
jgi:hypothetical protein